MKKLLLPMIGLVIGSTITGGTIYAVKTIRHNAEVERLKTIFNKQMTEAQNLVDTLNSHIMNIKEKNKKIKEKLDEIRDKGEKNYNQIEKIYKQAATSTFYTLQNAKSQPVTYYLAYYETSSKEIKATTEQTAFLKEEFQQIPTDLDTLLELGVKSSGRDLIKSKQKFEELTNLDKSTTLASVVDIILEQSNLGAQKLIDFFQKQLDALKQLREDVDTLNKKTFIELLKKIKKDITEEAWTKKPILTQLTEIKTILETLKSEYDILHEEVEKTNKDLEEISRDLDEILSRTERHDENPVYSPDGKELLKFGYFKNKEGKWQIKPIDKKVNKVPTKLPEFITILDNPFENNENETITGIESWDTSNVTSMFKMFAETPNFNQDLSNFNTSQVTKMRSMFYKAHKFNKPLNNFDTSKVIDISHMFYEAHEFNQEINHFNTSKVENMMYMFYKAHKFNKPIGDWDTSNVENMWSMFYEASDFNQPIGDWITSKVTTMRWMFGHTKNFNQDISNWDTQKVISVPYMFHAAKAFNQDLSKWKLSEDLKEYENFNVAGHKDFNRQKLPHGLVITQYVREALEPVFKDRFHKQMTYQDVEDKIREFNNSSHNDVKLVGIEWANKKNKLQNDTTRVSLKFKFKGYERSIFMAIGKLLDTPPKK